MLTDIVVERRGTKIFVELEDSIHFSALVLKNWGVYGVEEYNADHGQGRWARVQKGNTRLEIGANILTAMEFIAWHDRSGKYGWHDVAFVRRVWS
jgi:hypothetical protein